MVSISERDLPTKAPSAHPPEADQTRATAALARRAGVLREDVASLQGDAGEVHRTTLTLDLSNRAARKGHQSPSVLLEDMFLNKGFSWTSLAKMMRVSIPAIRKWRKGDSISGENRRRLSILAAFIDVLEEHYKVSDPASWMEMPLMEDPPVTAVEIYANGNFQVLLEYAGGHFDAAAVLDESMPGWRESHVPSEFEVFTGPDGEPAFARKQE